VMILQTEEEIQGSCEIHCQFYRGSEAN
jgi:hypothetical protein